MRNDGGYAAFRRPRGADLARSIPPKKLARGFVVDMSSRLQSSIVLIDGALGILGENRDKVLPLLRRPDQNGQLSRLGQPIQEFLNPKAGGMIVPTVRD